MELAQAEPTRRTNLFTERGICRPLASSADAPSPRLADSASRRRQRYELSRSISHASACRQLGETLDQVGATARSVKDVVETTQDIAPDLKHESARLRSIAIRAGGPLSSTAQS
jgi:hypothetical protein